MSIALNELRVQNSIASGEKLIVAGATAEVQIDYDVLARAIVEQWSGSTLAGSSQSVKSAIDAAKTTSETLNTNIAELQTRISQVASGTPDPVNTIAEMTDHSKIYVYTGSEQGEFTGYWYSYDSTQEKFVPRGEYGGAVTSTTFNQHGVPADDFAVGEALAEKADSSDVTALETALESKADTSDVTALDTRVTAVEDGLNDTNERLTPLEDVVLTKTEKNYIEGKKISAEVPPTITDDADICISEHIPCDTWTGRVGFDCNDGSKTDYRIVFYDENDTCLHNFKLPSSVGDYTSRSIDLDTQITAGTPAYVIFSFKAGTVGRVYISNTETLWEATTQVSEGLDGKVVELREDVDEIVSELDNLQITPEDTTFFTKSANICDPATCIDGQYVNQATGAFADNATHKRTDYISVEPNKSYYVVASDNDAKDTRYAFYKDDKTFISGGLIPKSGGLQTFTSPENAAYMVASVASTAYDIMVAQTDTVIPFESYAFYIDPQYINIGSEAKLNLPAKVYGTVGIELNIYFENITEDWTRYDWDVICAVGRQMERGYQITPTASDVGTKTLTIKATDEYGNVNTVSTSLVITAANAGSGQTKTVIVLGDSTTNNGKVIEKLHENFASDVMSITTLGTRGTAPNNHEGRSGWSWDTYFTKESVTYTDGRGTVYNPFYNPSTQTFDASYYFANSGISKPDFFIVNMGINDVFGFTSDSAYESGVTTILERAESAVQSVLDATTTTKVCICLTIPPNHSQDAFGKAYNCGQTRNRYKRNNTLWVDALMNLFKDRESERIYLIPINACLDTVYNMGMETLPVNARNTDITYQSPIGNGGVHPVESGYWQIADVYTAFIKANL